MSTTEIQKILDGLSFIKKGLVLLFPFLTVILYAAFTDHVHYEDTRAQVIEMKPRVDTMWPFFLQEHPEQRRSKDYNDSFAKQP